MNANPTLPAWVTILASALVTFLSTVPLAGLPWWEGALITAVIAAATWIAHLQTSRADKAKLSAMSARLPMAVLALCCLTHLSGCLSVAPVVPVTPANQAQVQTCQSTASLHNGVVIGDFTLGAAGTALGSIGALASDSTTKTDLAITTAVLGGLSAVGVAVAGLTSVSFTNDHCTDVVGPLPAGKRTAVVWVPDQVSP